MKKYRQSNSFAATTTGCDTGDTENTGHPVYEIFCIILKKFDPVLLEKLLGVADLFEYLKQLWNKTEKTEEKKGRKDNENIRTGSIKENCKKSLFVKLVNTERNESLVEQSISKEFLDLSAVVRVVLKMDKEGMASMALSKGDAEILGMTEEEIYAAALANTLRLFPPKLMNLGRYIEMSIGAKLPLGEDEVTTYILTNQKEVDGAIYFMSPEVVGAIAEALEDDLYILPSSVNEVLLVRASELEDGVDELKEMVRDANETVVAEKDILSYNVYHYDKEHGITIAA